MVESKLAFWASEILLPVADYCVLEIEPLQAGERQPTASKYTKTALSP